MMYYVFVALLTLLTLILAERRGLRGEVSSEGFANSLWHRLLSIKTDWFTGESIATSNGDSSLIKPKNFQETIKVEVIRLDQLMNELKLEKVKLLKLEAEGFEPEILIGAGERIKDIEYIAIDGGYERGIEEEQTFTTLTNYLIKKDFEISDIYFPWYRALFKNLKF